MKTVIISVIIGIALVGSAYFVIQNKTEEETTVVKDNVSIVDGKQIIEIRAKDGYLPQRSVAQAGLPTILRFDTSGTFDCSASVSIPSENISQTLPQTGTTDIELASAEVGILKGTCGMGMNPFEIEFKG